MPSWSFAILYAALGAGILGCSSAPAASGGAGGGGGAGGSDGGTACAPSFTGDVVHLAAGATIPSGADQTYCLRWTTPDELDVTGYTGALGPGGHHALLLTRASSTDPDGFAPCSEATIMDAEVLGPFGMVAGVSFGSNGEQIAFPATPSPTGLRIPAGTQLILDTHLINPTAQSLDACVSIDLARGTVDVPLDLVTVLPAAEYALSVPAHGSVSVSYPQPSGGSFQIVGAWGHMHDGATQFLLSIKETGMTLFQTDDWAEPKPMMFGSQTVLVDSTQSFQLDCSFANEGSAAVGFPDQMCVGAMYLLPCAVPGGC
jgi:hypothetical protein